jgi:plasmid maintenance system antidote protein VapI
MAVTHAAQLDDHVARLLPPGQDVIRGALRARGNTVTGLAAELGISRKHLSTLVNGRAPLVDPLRARLCTLLGIEPELMACLVHDGRTDEPAPHGAMRGTVVASGDLTAPMEAWQILEA